MDEDDKQRRAECEWRYAAEAVCKALVWRAAVEERLGELPGLLRSLPDRLRRAGMPTHLDCDGVAEESAAEVLAQLETGRTRGKKYGEAHVRNGRWIKRQMARIEMNKTTGSRRRDSERPRGTRLRTRFARRVIEERKEASRRESHRQLNPDRGAD